MVFTTTNIPDDTLTALPEPAAQMMTLLWNGLHIPNDLIATQDSSIYVATPLLRRLTAHFCTTIIKVTAEPETTTETAVINPRLRPYTKHIAKYYDRLNESKWEVFNSLVSRQLTQCVPHSQNRTSWRFTREVRVTYVLNFSAARSTFAKRCQLDLSVAITTGATTHRLLRATRKSINRH